MLLSSLPVLLEKNDTPLRHSSISNTIRQRQWNLSKFTQKAHDYFFWEEDIWNRYIVK